jgi:hypothetical protein
MTMLSQIRRSILAGSILIVVCWASTSSAQSLLQKTFPNYTVALLSVSGNADFAFRITWNSSSIVNVTLNDVTGPQNISDIEMVAFGSDRLFIGGHGSHYDNSFVVNSVNGAVVDHFLASGFAISPGSRFVAFKQVLSRSTSVSSYTFLVYDLSVGPAQNRMGAAANSGPFGGENGLAAGRAAYPPENRAQESYTFLGTDPGLYHSPRSDVWWLSDSSLAFADFSNGVLKIVRAAVGADVRNITIQEYPMDPAAILQPLNGTRDIKLLHVQSIVPVSGQSNAARVTFAPAAGIKLAQYSIDVTF